jgi:2,4-dienoyl-CoA reductase-like NADH-dependent reductase (Old Yellow Enzyme family)
MCFDHTMNQLFETWAIRGQAFRNRVFVSPMCQYSCEEGVANHWHLVHLGSRAVGGAGLVLIEATAVNPTGRITPKDMGLWNDPQANALRPIVSFIREQGSVAGIQLAHAGRKGSAQVPWEGGKALNAAQSPWLTLAPSAIPFDRDWPTPKEMNLSDIEQVIEEFKAATTRSLTAGFQVLEIHMAHGYLLHQFLSPLSNHRKDEYGGSIQNRMRLSMRVTKAVRSIWPETYPLFVRISATDWVAGGWSEDDSVALARELKEAGVDLIDCSSGGIQPQIKIPTAPGYQVRFSEKIRREVGILTGAVGLITQPKQAQTMITIGQADAVLLARELLRDPYWPQHAARELGCAIEWPLQYQRAKL